ncbi:uncharacterized protein K444DRAFT_619470 [Hyaloscypha bicolor E]|uniref:Uncharacterized protein n=1 Tax=Hyaloscypha bicolor E TaxID=1095630 RepID=A0A2J6SPR3_9HELO|nr:uncharacterized protein K444DRAFT_619470 [Hyaloscypha bicolor E]PMD52765.1 hypothetical protein K444DRAFT_619470 [Hyaloscypha bicolor E]
MEGFIPITLAIAWKASILSSSAVLSFELPNDPRSAPPPQGYPPSSRVETRLRIVGAL